MTNMPMPLYEWHLRAIHFEEELNRIVIGLSPVIRLLLIAIFSRGHVLLEGHVGVGKTTLLRAAARALGGGYQRIEGTVDLMPQDLIYHTYVDEAGKPRVEAGPLLASGSDLSVFFFNEINRARPQVHALLLRVMAERTVSAFNRLYHFPHLQVFADRNQVEKDETFDLPGAARDRFLMEINVAPADDPAIHRQLTFDTRFHDTERLIQSLEPGLLGYQDLTSFHVDIQEQVFCSDAIQQYVEHLRRATHYPMEFGIVLPEVEMESLMRVGIGPRGASMLVRAAKVAAWLDGRMHLEPQDLAQVFHPVVGHRIFFNPIYELQREWLAPAFSQAILQAVPTP